MRLLKARVAAMSLITMAGLGLTMSVGHTQEISDDVVKIGVLTDMSGVYQAMSGAGSVEAARMAIEDFGGTVLGKRIELISGDHQNKPDVGAALARRWFDTEQVDMINDLVFSAVALAVQEIGRSKGKVTLATTPAALSLIGEQCSPTGAMWTWDTYATGIGLSRALVNEGHEKWYFIAADYAFGHSQVEEATKAIKEAGGEVLGATFHPIGTGDFAAYLLEAQQGNPDVIGLANTTSDTVNTLKQAREFGLEQRMVGTVLNLSDVHGMGLQTAQGLNLVTVWYWDLNDETRAWAQRYFERRNVMPDQFQAGVYSSTLHYLKAIEAAGTDDAAAVMEKMRSMPVQDMFTKNGKLRADGRMVYDIYIAQVKTPEESKGPWDYYNIIQTIPADEAFLPLSESKCPLVSN